VNYLHHKPIIVVVLITLVSVLSAKITQAWLFCVICSQLDMSCGLFAMLRQHTMCSRILLRWRRKRL